MRRLKFVLGVVFGVGLAAATVTVAQPFPASTQLAINQLTTGVIPFTALRNVASAYVSFGSTGGVNGYGFRDNGGVMEAKNSGGSWLPLPTSSTLPTAASFITRVAEANLSNETALAGLATALLINTTTTGVPTAYAGATCTNQFVRALSAVGAATCASIVLTTDTTGTLPVGNGGTGLTAGTSGGIPYFSATNTIASSALLTANALLLGGGAGTTPAALGSLGTTTTVLHGNAAGSPTFGAVVLTTDVSGILPGANGGTANGFLAFAGPATSLKTWTGPNQNAALLTDAAAVTTAQGGTGLAVYAVGDLIQASGTTTLARLAATSTGNALISGGVGTISAWGKIGLTTHVSGVLGPTFGGTGFSSYTVGDLLYANSTTSLARLNAVATGMVLTSAGTSTAPAYGCPCIASTTLTNAQILALPTTPITVLAAAGANMSTVVDYVVVQANFTGGAYTNVDTDGFMALFYNTNIQWSNYLANSVADSLTFLSVFLDNTGKRVVFREYQDDADPANDWGPLVSVATGVAFNNQALSISIDNDGSGNLTGGNAANSMVVRVSYRIAALP